MSKFRVSQGELWARLYLIEADTLEEAMEIYEKYLNTGEEPENMYMYDPEYVDDIKSDVVWYDEEGNIKT